MRKQSLATALGELATTEDTINSRADAVLAIVKASGIRDGAAFNSAVREAYAANGWHTSPGKPSRGNRGSSVPATVKQYVSLIRGAFKLGLNVGGFKTFHALRKTLKAARVAAKPRPVRQDSRLAGVRLVKSDELIGAPFHDLTVLYENLNRQQKAKLAAEVNKLVREYKPAAAPSLELVRAAA